MPARRSLLSRLTFARTLVSSLGLAAMAAMPAHAASTANVWAEGTVEVQYEDSSQGAHVHHYLDTAKGRYSLTFPGKAPHTLARGAKVRVTGTQNGATLALSTTTSTSVTSVSPAPLPNTLGEQKIAILMVNFVDNTTQPYTLTDGGTVLGQTSGFMQENSSSQTWLTGATFGWYTLPIAQTCDTTSIASYADQAAAANGVTLSNYNHIVYVFPNNSTCMWSGQGTVGGTGGRIWINGRFELKTLAHELGHNFGLYHSHSLECGTAVIGTTCTTYDYGDTVDVMGNTTSSHYNAFQKERLGWLNNGTMPPITTVTASGSYTLTPYENGNGSRALKILKSVDATTGARTWYYVEFRQPTGYDAPLSTLTAGNVTAGVLVRTGADNDISSSLLLDMTPNSSVYADWNDPALLPGLSYSDAAAGVTITPTAASSTGATVYVNLANTTTTSTTTTSTTSTVTSLTVAASTAAASYSAGQTVVANTSVSAGSVVSSGASVIFTITPPTGAATMLSATTDSTGKASVSYRLPRKATKGTYQVKVQATSGSLSGTATTSFSVN